MTVCFRSRCVVREIVHEASVNHSVGSAGADAQRSRGGLLDVAKEVLSQSGAGPRLDKIAREAAVGPGTLYRLFRAREDLLEAVYRTEVEKLAAPERKFADPLPPMEGLRAW